MVMTLVSGSQTSASASNSAGASAAEGTSTTSNVGEALAFEKFRRRFDIALMDIRLRPLLRGGEFLQRFDIRRIAGEGHERRFVRIGCCCGHSRSSITDRCRLPAVVAPALSR